MITKDRRRVFLRSLVTIAALAAAVSAVRAGPALAANTVYWGNFANNTISFANLDGSGGGGQLSTPGATEHGPWGMAIDLPANKIYWANDSSDTIGFANLDGSGGGQLNTTGTTPDFPLGVAIDPAANKIYWANDSSDTIGFANLDGSGGGGLLDTTGATLDEPDGVAIDPATNRIYWANDGNDTIGSASLDNTGGGGQLNTAGALHHAQGLAIDAATNKIYATNDGNNTIAFVNLDGSGGGQLNTTGTTPDSPEGVAIDPAANKVYWANFGNSTIAFANADGSGGGGVLPTSGATQDFPDFPVLLKIPSGTHAPAVSGGSAQGSVLSCSRGDWAPDLLGSFLYQVPQSYSYSWTRNGTPISGATSSSITANSAGGYTCSVTAHNLAGTATQTSPGFTVSPPPHVTRTSVGNQQITLTMPSPSVCTAKTSKLAVRLTSTKKSKGTKLKFSKSAFYIDRGVKHKHHKHGKTVITYTANATKSHVPATVDLSLTGLKSGTHTLKVLLSYKQTKREHGHRKTVTVAKTLKVKFSVC